MVAAIGTLIVVVFGAIGLLFQQILKQVGRLAETLSTLHETANRELSALRGEVQSLRDRLEESHRAASDVRAALEARESRDPEGR